MAQPFTALRLQKRGNQVAVQPSAVKSDALDTLLVDLRRSSVEVAKQGPITKDYLEVLGLLGIYNLKQGSVLVVVTEAEQVALLEDRPIYRVTRTQLLGEDNAITQDEKMLLDLLRSAVDPDGCGRNLFFSYGTDLTLNLQSAARTARDPKLSGLAPPDRADPRFFWNKTLSKPLLDAGATAFVLTMILGSVAQVQNTVAGQAISVTLIARRSTLRAGTRHWRRGADREGNAANFVETEQVVDLGNGRLICSYVQLRGSIPLLWTQIPNIKYKPPTKIGSESANQKAFDLHFSGLVDKYKDVVAIDLVNQKGTEGLLESTFRRESERFRRSQAGLTYVAFDFHHECGKGRWGNLSKLWDQVAKDAAQHGMWVKDKGTVTAEQRGVMRTNCVDCLDRTNVVQGILGRKALEAALRMGRALTEQQDLATTYLQLERAFKIMWADHGDDISRQYAGTGALKSGFTRTGVRTMGGAIDDGVKSVMRYYLNNFEDGQKQDAFDLITGAYQLPPTSRGISSFRSQASPLLPILVAVVAIAFGLQQTLKHVHHHVAPVLLLAKAPTTPPPSLMRAALFPLMLGGLLFYMILKNGRHLVNRPRLCPQLANTVDSA